MIVDIEPLRRSAGRFRLGFRIAAGVALCGAAVLLVAMILWPGATGAMLSDLAGHPLSPRLWQGAALAGIALVGLCLYAATFVAAARVCGVLIDGDPAAAGPLARRLSRWLWLLLGWSVASHTLAVLVVTAHAGPGERALSVALGGQQVSIAVAALIATFLAHALTFGAALWQDHREIV